jgi:hypothetical protein
MATAEPNEGPKNSVGFQGTAPIDRSASGLNYQKYQMETTARGVNGVARRTTVEPSTLFSHPMSSGQFGGGNNAKAATFSSPEEE